MKISYVDLDERIKDTLRSHLQKVLVLKYKTLPLPGQEDMVRDIYSDNVVDTMKNMVVEYYRLERERDLDIDISQEDLVKLYYRIA